MITHLFVTEDEITFLIKQENSKQILSFTKEVKELSLTKDEAFDLALILLKFSKTK